MMTHFMYTRRGTIKCQEKKILSSQLICSEKISLHITANKKFLHTLPADVYLYFSHHRLIIVFIWIICMYMILMDSYFIDNGLISIGKS